MRNVKISTDKKPNRVHDAYSRIKAAVLSNALPPGYQATEPEIAARLGMSRTPVREALIRLEAEGLVELVPRRGARVLPIQASDMRDIYEILTALEPEAAAALARKKPSAECLAPLTDSVDRMAAALRDGNLDAWAAEDDLFHRTLLELHGNSRLTDIVEELFDQVHRVRVATLRHREAPHRSTEDHRLLVQALMAGDANAARDMFRAHRIRVGRELLEILDRQALQIL